MIIKRVFYYLDCNDQDKLFELLDKQVEDGFITYSYDQNEGIIIIDSSMIDEEDDIFKELKDMGVSEEDPLDYDIESEDDMFDDFFNEDDFED